MLRFLIDECLSPRLAIIAQNSGFYLSTHVTWAGLAARDDWAVVRHAIDEGYVIVTNNKKDYISLVGREEIHCGLVCFSAGLGLMDFRLQKAMLELTMDELAGNEPVNEVLEFNLKADGKIEILRYNFFLGSKRLPEIIKL